jgi:hypothetical protein
MSNAPRLPTMGAGAVLVVMALLALVQVPPAGGFTLRTVSGVVKDSTGAPVAGAHVGIFAYESTFEITPANGTFSFAAPQSSTPYDVQLLFPCAKDQRKSVLLDADKTVDFTVPAAPTRDNFGYRCRPTSRAYIDISNTGTRLSFLSPDDDETAVSLPFTFRLYGVDYSTINVGTNGLVSFNSTVVSSNNLPLPDPNMPNAALYPFWDDLVIDENGGVFTEVRGSAPNREFIIEWSNVHFYLQDNDRAYFEVILRENRSIQFLYGDQGRESARGLRARGTSATIGIENASGNDAIQQSFGTPSIDDNMGMEFTAPK